MDRSLVIKEIDELQQEYCSQCFLKKHFREEFSKTYAHQFCIKNCTVGDAIQQRGNLLLQKEKRRVKP